MELEIYESVINKQLAQSTTVTKYNGEFNFKLANNKSGKTHITFTAPFAKKPKLNVIVSINDGSVLVRHTIEKFDNTGFILHIINTDLVNEVAGSVNWNAEQI